MHFNTTEYLSYLETLAPSGRKKLGNLYKAYTQGLAPDARRNFEDKSVDIIIAASPDTLNTCYTQALKNLADAAKRSNIQVNSGFIVEPYVGDDKGTIIKPDDEYVARIDERRMASAGLLSSESDPSQTPFSLTRFRQNLQDFIASFEGVDVFAVSTDDAKNSTQPVFYSYGKQSQTSKAEDPQTAAHKKPGPGRGYDDAT